MGKTAPVSLLLIVQQKEAHTAEFPQFIRNKRNAIAASAQSIGVEGWLFDGAGGGQVAFWQCTQSGESADHVHDYDEYFIVVEGKYTVIIDGVATVIGAGEECFIAKGIPHAGRFIAGTRAIYAFGGKRAKRQMEDVVFCAENSGQQ